MIDLLAYDDGEFLLIYIQHDAEMKDPVDGFFNFSI